jgi:hypothetical protein
MNEQNVIGLNFEKYNNQRSPEIRRKIINFIEEFRENKDKLIAMQAYKEILSENKLPAYMFLGYLFCNAYSYNLEGWTEVKDLSFQFLFAEQKAITEKDLLEG